jgi:hypothetical protein
MRANLAFAFTVSTVAASLLLASCATDPFMAGSTASITKRPHKRSTVAYRTVSPPSETATAKAPLDKAPETATAAAAPQVPAAPTAPVTTGAVAAPPAPAGAAEEVTTKEDPRWQWCEQRHLDHQAGKAPAGAQDLEQKLKDDRTCAAIYAERAGDQQPTGQAPQPIDTGSISQAPEAGR